MLVFEEKGKPQYPEKNPLGARERTNTSKLDPHMASTPGLELLHWWEESALTSAPPLLPITIGLLTVLNAISFSHVIYPLDNAIQRLNI